jgi:hypothetical protein
MVNSSTVHTTTGDRISDIEGSAEAMTLSEAARWISRKAGVPEPHLSTLHRWARGGVRGVRLRTTRVGAKFWTTAASLADFLDALNGSTEHRESGNRTGDSPSFSQSVRREQIEAACTDIEHLCRGFE